MSRIHPRPLAPTILHLAALQTRCRSCGGPLWVAYHKHRQIHTLTGLVRLILPARRCPNPACALYHQPVRPEGEGHYALPPGEAGLDVISRVGQFRFAEQPMLPET